MDWDVFISHASEDKAEVARPLARRLERQGLRVWLDEQELVVSDSLRAKIDHGLARSRWGVVVLSRAFLDKAWPQAELDGLLARELSGQRVVLPVWHGVTAGEVARRSPLLAARLGASTSDGLDAVCAALLQAMDRAPAIAADEPPDGGLLGFWRSLAERGRLPYEAVGEFLSRRESYAGQRVGDYQVTDLVGIGGTGAVFRAAHAAIGKIVALKLFFPVTEELRAVTAATERAVRGLSALRHPNIAALLDYGYAPLGPHVAPYLAYELVRGRSLQDWSRALEQGASDRPGGAWRDVIARQLTVAIAIAEALGAAHACRFLGTLGFEEVGVLHGDLKQSNIMVRDEDETPVIA